MFELALDRSLLDALDEHQAASSESQILFGSNSRRCPEQEPRFNEFASHIRFPKFNYQTALDHFASHSATAFNHTIGRSHRQAAGHIFLRLGSPLKLGAEAARSTPLSSPLPPCRSSPNCRRHLWRVLIVTISSPRCNPMSTQQIRLRDTGCACQNKTRPTCCGRVPFGTATVGPTCSDEWAV